MDFARLLICPGAQKAGTTWLHRVLKKHPDFWIPPQKELDYLFYHRPSREKYVAKLGAKLQDPNLKPIAREWISLFIQNWNLALYPRLFVGCKDKFSADISPNYSRMSANELVSAEKIVKGAKIVIILRDPVERAWSHAKYASKTWQIEDRELRFEKCTKFVSSAACDVMSDYPRLVGQWSRQFGPNNVLVLFYDELERAPESFINMVLAFIGATSYPQDIVRNLYERPNSGETVPVPEAVQSELSKRYAPRLAELRGLLATEWGFRGDEPEWLVGAQM